MKNPHRRTNYSNQRETVEQGQRALTQAAMIPFRRSIEIQRNLGEILMNGLELTEPLQRATTDLTRSGLRNYLTVVDDAMSEVTQGSGTGQAGGQRGIHGREDRLQSAGGQGDHYGQRASQPQTEEYDRQTQPGGAPPGQAAQQQAPSQQAPPQQAPPQEAVQQPQERVHGRIHPSAVDQSSGQQSPEVEDERPGESPSELSQSTR